MIENKTFNKICIICNKEFISNTPRNKYCNKECKRIGRNLISKKYRKLPKVKAREKEYCKKYQHKYPEKLKIYNKNSYKNPNKRKYITEYIRKKRKFILDYKIDKCCSLCGWKEHPEVLQFHHIDSNKKEYNIALIRSIEIFNEEIKKCTLLCPNCHFWYHYKEKKDRINNE